MGHCRVSFCLNPRARISMKLFYSIALTTFFRISVNYFHEIIISYERLSQKSNVQRTWTGTKDVNTVQPAELNAPLVLQVDFHHGEDILMEAVSDETS